MDIQVGHVGTWGLVDKKNNGLSIQRFVVFFTFFLQGTGVGRPFRKDIVSQILLQLIWHVTICVHLLWMTISESCQVWDCWSCEGMVSGEGIHWAGFDTAMLAAVLVALVGFALMRTWSRTCHWLGVTRKYDASYESAKKESPYSIYKLYASNISKRPWLHSVPLFCGSFR